MSSLRTLAVRSLLLGVAALMLPACYSNDMRKFESTVNRPTTIRIVQSMTDGAVLWEKEIPVQHSLTVNLDRAGEFEMMSVNPTNPATSFNWALFDDRGRRIESGREELPGLPVRLEMALRDAPEWPAGYTPPGGDDADIPPVEILERERPPVQLEEGEADAEPATEAPAEEEAPAEAPAVEEAPAEAPAAETPATEAPAAETPAEPVEEPSK